MLKDLDTDTILFCSKSAAQMAGYGGPYQDLWNTPSSKFFPAFYQQFAEDDRAVFAGGKVTEPFVERVRPSNNEDHGDLLMTIKWPIALPGANLIALQAFNLTRIDSNLRSSRSYGAQMSAELETAHVNSIRLEAEVHEIVRKLAAMN